MKIIMLASGTINSSLTYRILSFGRELVRRGHQVTILAPRLDKYSNFQPERFTEIDGVRVIRPFQLPTRRVGLSLIPYIVSAACQLVFSRADLVYLYKPTPLTIVGLVPKFLRRTPVVLDMDDLGSEVMRLEGQSAVRIKLVRWCEWAAARFATAIVSVSTYLRETYQKQYPDKRVVWIPNGTDARLLRQGSQPNDTGKTRVVMIGAIERTDIIEPLIEAFAYALARLPQAIELVLIGDGPSKTHFEDLVERLGIAEHVRFTGWLAKRQFSAYAKHGDIGYCVMPDNVTTRACSNMKVFDYMALGVVPLVSDVGDLAGYAACGRVGYCVAADDQQALREGLLAALQDNDRLQRAYAAQQLAEQQYDWSVLTAHLETVCKEITQ